MFQTLSSLVDLQTQLLQGRGGAGKKSLSFPRKLAKPAFPHAGKPPFKRSGFELRLGYYLTGKLALNSFVDTRHVQHNVVVLPTLPTCVLIIDHLMQVVRPVCHMYQVLLHLSGHFVGLGGSFAFVSDLSVIKLR